LAASAVCAKKIWQIRFAGCKGVVVVDPSLKGGKQLYFRPSMKKFDSDHNVLEILNHSKYLPGYLNHQVIAILSALGVTDSSLLELQMNDVL